MNSNLGTRYINEVNFKEITNWSVGSILHNTSLYKNDFPLIAIKNLILKNKNKETIDDIKLYKQVTVKLYGKGVIQRGEEVLGKNIGTKNQFKITKGQFIMSKIDARNGAFGIVPLELDGAITTQDFLSYNINHDMILPQFFVLLTASKKFTELCQKASSGTTGRQRVNESAFLNFEIPVPSKTIQKKLIDNYNSLYEKSEKLIKSAINIEKKNEIEINNILGIIEKVYQKKNGFNLIDFKDLERWDTESLLSSENEIQSRYPFIKFESIITDLRNGISARNYSEKGMRFLRVSDVKKNRIDDSSIRFINKYVESDIISPKTILITRKGTVGNAYYFNTPFEAVASSEIFIIKINESLILGEYLTGINSFNFIQNQYKERYTGTIMPSLSQTKLKEIKIPLPPLDKQKEIIDYIVKAKKKYNSALSESISLKNEAIKNFELQIFN